MSRGCASAGATMCCTARTATAGRCASRPSACWRPRPMPCTMAQLFRQLTSHVVLFAHTGPELSAEQREQLAARDIRIVADAVAGLESVNDRLTGVRLRDGTVVPRQALVVTPRYVARSKVLASLELHPTPHPFG